MSRKSSMKLFTHSVEALVCHLSRLSVCAGLGFAVLQFWPWKIRRKLPSNVRWLKIDPNLVIHHAFGYLCRCHSATGVGANAAEHWEQSVSGLRCLGAPLARPARDRENNAPHRSKPLPPLRTQLPDRSKPLRRLTAGLEK